MGMTGNVNHVQLEVLERPAAEFENFMEALKTEISIVVQLPRYLLFGDRKEGE